MFRRSWLTSFVSAVLLSIFLSSCLGKRVRCKHLDTSSMELLRVSDLTGDPYLSDYLERNLFKILSVKEGTEGKYLLEITLGRLYTQSVGHSEGGYQAHNLIYLKASFNIYQAGRVEPMVSRTLTLEDSYYVNPNPNIALSRRKRAIDRLSVRLVREIERAFAISCSLKPKVSASPPE